MHVFYTLQWHRIIPHSAKVKGWTVTPSHYLNNQLDTVWLPSKNAPPRPGRPTPARAQERSRVTKYLVKRFLLMSPRCSAWRC